MPLRLNIQGYDDRRDVILALVNSGYTVRQEEVKDDRYPYQSTYYVVIENSADCKLKKE